MCIRLCFLASLIWYGSFPLTADILYSTPDLGTLGGCCSFGNSLNNAGQVVGVFYTSDYLSRAFLYSNGQMTDLSTLGDSSGGEAINSTGQIVGSFTPTPVGTPRAFLYNSGQMTDLNDFIDPALRITLTYATAINDQG